MEQLDFGKEGRYVKLNRKKDPLVKLNAIIPRDETVMFKTIILFALYNLSDDQVECRILDRLSLTRFLGLELKDNVPDARTVRLYRDKLAQAGVIEELSADFDGYLARKGYKAAMGSRIIDASIASVPEAEKHKV